MTSSPKINSLDFNKMDTLVAYIDILGFKEMIASNQTTLVERYFNRVLETLTGIQKIKGSKLQKSLMSDAIILSYPLENNNTHSIQQIIHAVAQVQCSLLQDGILARGSIALGSMMIDSENNVLVGSGLVKAFQLEAEAVNARIIIDPEIVNLYNDRLDFVTSINQDGNLIFEPNRHLRNEFKRFLESNYLFLDYITYFFVDGKFLSANLTNKERGNCLVEIVRKGVKNPSHFSKHLWLAHYVSLVSIEDREEIQKLIYGYGVATF